MEASEAAPLSLRKKGRLAQNPLVQDIGSGWQTVKGQRKRVTGIDWDTWRRKRKVTANMVANSSLAPYEGSGPMMYQDVFGLSGKRVHRKVIRDSWDQMTPEEIKDKTERDAEAFLRAAMLDAEEQLDYVATPPVATAASDKGGDRERWKKDLFPQVKAMIDSEANGLHFTGRMATEYKNGKAVMMPTFTNETWRPDLVTGEPERIPGAPHPNTLSIAEHERLHRYLRGHSPPAAQGALSRPVGSGDHGAEGAEGVAGAAGRTQADQEEATEDAVGGVVHLLRAQAAKANQTVAQYVDELKKGRVKLSKHKRMLKHVKGFTLENLERMSNGTFAYNSAWGPARVIAGPKDARFGDTWTGGGMGAGAAVPGRKRRDAAWFRERALKGNDKAQLSLALCYTMGQGVARDLAKAAAWFARSARQGNVEALTQLALCYRYGEGVAASNQTSMRLLASAAARGGRDAQEELGLSLLDGSYGQPPNASAAARMLRTAAAQGSKRAATRLGLAYAEGRHGLPRDDDNAEWFLAQAAGAYRKGHRSGTAGKRVREGARAMLKLGLRFRNGRGVKKDSTKAVDWFAKAALKGLPRAHLCLGMCYLEGNGVPRDDTIGAQQVATAAKRGCKEAVFNYAMLLLQGRGLPQDAAAARKWFLTGAQQGDAQCMVNAGVCLAHGVGGEANDQQARRWFLEAATHQGTAGQAFFNLAILCEEGRGGEERSPAQALAYLRRAASANYTEALRGLGERLLAEAAAAAPGANAVGAGPEASGAALRHEALALLRRAADVNGTADVDSMLILAGHMSTGARGAAAEADNDEAACLYLEAITRGAAADCVDLKWLEKVVRRGAGGSLAAKQLYIEVVGSTPAPCGPAPLAPGGAPMIEAGNAGTRSGDGETALVAKEGAVGAVGVGQLSIQEVKRRQVVANDLLRELAEGGNLEYKYRYACLLLSQTQAEHGGDEASAQALDIMEQAAASGHTGAMYFMGKAHAGGKYKLPSSDLAAVEWLARAAEAGHAQAQFTLGLFYQHGRGVAKDPFMATEWFSEAAEQGDAQAQFALGVALGKGKGIAKSHEQACYWYAKAAMQGNGKAQFNLALRLTEGLGCVKDAAAAAYWFGQAAHKGVFGRAARVKKGVLQKAATRELVQPMTDAPSGTQRQERLPARRMVKLSEFKGIQWNRNPASFRKGSQRDLANMLRAEGKRLPRCVLVDDPDAPDYGKIYLTRPQNEAKERAMARLLMAHGLDWDAMLLDHELNVFQWSKGQLRLRANKLMAKRLAAPADVLFKHEKRQLPRLRRLWRQLQQQHVDQRGYLARSRAAIAAIDGRNMCEALRENASAARLQQLQESRHYIAAQLASAAGGACGDDADLWLAPAAALDGSTRRLPCANLTLGLSLEAPSDATTLTEAGLASPGAEAATGREVAAWRADAPGGLVDKGDSNVHARDGMPSFLFRHLHQMLKRQQEVDMAASA